MAAQGYAPQPFGPQEGLGFAYKGVVEHFDDDGKFVVHNYLLQIIVDVNSISRYYIRVKGCAMIFNERLKQLREEKAKTQDTTARDLGMPVRSYQRLEADGAKSNYDTLLKIADYYDVSVDWLMGRTDKRDVNR